MSFIERRIDVTITLGTGTFGEDIGDTITLEGHRTQAQVVGYGGDTQGELYLQIYGVSQSIMNQLTAIGPTMASVRGKNSILVAAGDEGSALSIIFQGTIDQAYGNYQGAPEVCLHITALSALVNAVKPVDATSVQGSVDAAAIMEALAGTMGLAFENNGVSVILSNPYLPGTAYDQVRALAKAADILFTIDRGTLAIWPKNTSRTGEAVKISPTTGMKGYPVFSSQGVNVSTIFAPGVKYGGQIDIESSIPAANGLWNVYAFAHQLESIRPGGPWHTHVGGYRSPTI